MKKAFLRKVISAGLFFAALSTIAPLGVSAASTTNIQTVGCTQSNNKSWCYTNNLGKKLIGISTINGTNNGNMRIGWISYQGRKYFVDSKGVIQTGVLKTDGQAIRNELPTAKNEYDSNGNLMVNNNESKNTTVTNNNGLSNNGTGTITKQDKNQESDSTGSISSTSVSGLPALPEKYPITVQASAETKILELMNQKRVEAGLKPLTMDNTLLEVARYKSNHMIQNNYFSHTNPDGTKWTNWLQKIGYKYSAAAENIAYNSYDPVELFTQWWNSAGHRQNMMNPSYTKVGIGVIQGNNKYMGTQEFSN